MALRVYNTMTQSKENLIPLRGRHLGMYVCGVTVYDLCHIGHARNAVVFDVIYRYLKYRGYEVTYVRNFTDVDDKIIKRAHQEGTNTEEIASKYIREFYTDMGALGLQEPTFEPRATEHIPEMIGMIQRLLEKGHAYQAGGDIYYAVGSFPEYGKLSKRSVDELQAGARVEIDERKRNPDLFLHLPSRRAVARVKASPPMPQPFWKGDEGRGQGSLRPELDWVIACRQRTNGPVQQTRCAETYRSLHAQNQE